ncbi:hypothetical protein [Mesorhizobium sp. M0006]|uniref:hypothetical protein n=1 Tax=Mesorhizobium sp. M0006 TaxID=2956838 RepID=UPI0033356485
MKRFESEYATRAAEKRKLRIYATDPMSGRRAPYRITIEIENEPDLMSGPSGTLIEVIDYDGWNRKFYKAVNLNEPALLMEGGLAPSESDPRFHQQMVYAVAMKVIDSARRALGRPVLFNKAGSRNKSARPKLRLHPHAFYGRNAFFDPDMNAILFGYFQADSKSPGANIPSQTVYTCLSHDIIAHEMTHAIVHRLRPYFIEATNLDVLAFHEAFSDIVALLQRFSYRELLTEYIKDSHGDLKKSEMLVDLAQQFGYAIGSGKALRSAIGISPKIANLAATHEPHERGAILVSAVFDGFFRAFQNKVGDLLRIASGSGKRPSGQLHPDLVNRLASEAASLSDRFLRICFRAFDYMPPVDVTFGDFLRALVTSDFELNPEDPDEVRFAIVEGFRERGIFPSGVQSLAEEALLWPSQINGPLPNLSPEMLEEARRFLNKSAASLDQDRVTRRNTRRTNTPQTATQTYQESALESIVLERVEQSVDSPPADLVPPTDDRGKLFGGLHAYAVNNKVLLGLDPDIAVAVVGFHAVHRIGADQRLVIEFVAQFMQTNKTLEADLAGLPFRGGATVIFGSEGEVRYIACKPMPSDMLPLDLKKSAEARLAKIKHAIEDFDQRDPRMAFSDASYMANRMKIRASFRALHGAD